MKKLVLLTGLLCLLIFLAGCIEDPKYNEDYCRQFSYEECPKECEVGPSCFVCEDIGCHSKAHQFWNVTTQQPEALSFILLPFFVLLILIPLGLAFAYAKITKKPVNYKKVFVIAMIALIILFFVFSLLRNL